MCSEGKDRGIMKIYGLGHPRSGNTWLQYICKCLGVSDYVKAHGGANFPGAAGIENWNTEYSMILVIRDYKEAILRHQLFEEEDITPEQVAKIVLDAEYIEGLQIYDDWPNKKIVVYYEDLILYPRVTILQIANFIGCGRLICQNFVSDLEEHKIKSLQIYTSTLGPSVTQGNKIDHHKFRLSEKERTEVDNLVKINAPHLYNKYLTRYNTGETTC